MRIRLNGEIREIADGLTLARLLDDLGIDPRSVAVAVNATVVPRASLNARPLAEQDEVEVIEAVGGG
ncbi:MAG: sulfur carrier protein ThiS [Candidatus Coatesbacteria bacterium]